MSDGLHRNLFAAAPVGLVLTTWEGEVLEVNRHFCETMGVTPAEAKALGALAFYPRAAERRRLMAELRQSGRLLGREVCLKRKDGRLVHSLVQAEVIRLPKQELILTTIQDVTGEKLAQRSVQAVRTLLELFASSPSREEYLRSVAGLLRDWCGCAAAGIRLIDPRRRVPYEASVGLSRGFLREEARLGLDTANCACLRGFREAEAVVRRSPGRAAGSFLCYTTRHGGGSPGTAPCPPVRTACRAAGFESIAWVAIRDQGKVLGTLHLLDPRPGRFSHQTIELLDSLAPLVSEALHKFDVADALRESERRFRAVFEGHHELMLLVEPKSGAIVDVNPAAALFFGRGRRQLRTMTLPELDLAVPRARVGSKNGSGNRAVQRRELTVRKAHGKPREIEISVSPLTVRKRRLLFLVARDISERRLLERRLLELGENERQRLGRDLHDSLGGELTGIALLTKALAQRLAAKSAPEAATAEEIVAHLNQAIAQARSLAHGLCPVELSGQHWVGCLQDLAVGVEHLPGVTCRLEFAVASPSLDNTVATHVFRITQEAVHNALRHGQAKNILIRFSRKKAGVRLEIRSDGADFPTWPASQRGLGLRTMRYRAEAIGARLDIGRGERGGTVVACELPASSLPQHRRRPLARRRDQPAVT